MFDQERLDPHGVGNFPNVLTIKDKSSRKSRVLVLLVFSQSSSLYIWFNFKLKREQEIAVDIMLMNQASNHDGVFRFGCFPKFQENTDMIIMCAPRN